MGVNTCPNGLPTTKRHVLLVRTAQDIVCLFLDHVTIGDDDLFLVERLLSYLVVS